MLQRFQGFLLLLLTCLLINISVHFNAKGEEQSKLLKDWTPTGLLQQEFIIEGEGSTSPHFLMRRARLGAKGDLTENAGVNFIGGLMEGADNEPALVNGYMDYHFSPALIVRAGKFLVPFGQDGPTAIAQNPAIERSHTSRQLNSYPLFRSVGVKLKGSTDNMGYSLALLNKAGSITDPEVSDVAGRFYVSLLDQLEIGISGNYGKDDL